MMMMNEEFCLVAINSQLRGKLEHRDTSCVGIH